MAAAGKMRGRITREGKVITGLPDRRLKGRITAKGELVDEEESPVGSEYFEWHNEAKKGIPLPAVPAEPKRLPLHRIFPNRRTRKQI